MSEQDRVVEQAGDESPADPGDGRRRSRAGLRRSLPGCLAVLVALAVVVGAFYFGVTRGLEALEERFGPPPDYPGPGTGRVTVRVREGETLTQIGRHLEQKNVVKSVEAFVVATRSEPEATSIQVGVYELKRRMAAEDALQALLDPSNMVTTTVTIPEGLRATKILGILAKKTEYSRQDFERAVEAGIGLPEYANGKPEGYLFPATYSFDPEATPREMLRRMVDRWRQAAEKVDLSRAAERLGYTPHELMTVASLAQAEVRKPEDMAKVARVIYNRIENPEVAGTGGLLQIDATVDYALGRELTANLTRKERRTTRSPYNTYLHPGLPPGPINSPGLAAMRAATNPAEGDWYFYVTVNLRTGETKFAETYEEFLRYERQNDQFCRQSDIC